MKVPENSAVMLTALLLTLDEIRRSFRMAGATFNVVCANSQNAVTASTMPRIRRSSPRYGTAPLVWPDAAGVWCSRRFTSHQLDGTYGESQARVATTSASTPVRSVGWSTGANRGLWLTGSSLRRLAAFALS